MRQFRILSMFWAIFLGTGNFSAYSQQMPERLKDKRPAKPQGKDMGGTMRSNAGLVPPGIMIGEAKRWMVAYQGMFDKMQGNLVGSRRIDDATILQQFKATPTDMTMQMHMAMVMYAPSDKASIMVMVPYIRKSMNHIMENGTRFNELTKGIWGR